MEQLLLERFGEQGVAGFFLVLARLSPLFVLAPMFSSKLVPGRVRGLVAVALAVGLTPVVIGDRRIPLGAVDYSGLLLKELLVGLGFAFALGALFAAVTVAGSFIDTLIGFSFGSLVDPVNGTQTTVLAQLYSLLGVLVFIAIGGDAWVLGGFARTYDVVGALELPSIATMVAGADDAFVGIFLAAVQIAGPIMLALILTDVAFGLVSRVVPQLNVFAVGFPAKLVVGMLLLGVTLPFVGGWLADEVQSSVSEALRTLKVA
ncbi:MAG TPA: flagellar biosynthetic protein FliR [Capillimicrobium sp.]|nr:flagellar biosynthetic protein FliR [Capillimicrobium sp.]